MPSLIGKGSSSQEDNIDGDGDGSASGSDAQHSDLDSAADTEADDQSSASGSDDGGDGENNNGDDDENDDDGINDDGAASDSSNAGERDLPATANSEDGLQEQEQEQEDDASASENDVSSGSDNDNDDLEEDEDNPNQSKSQSMELQDEDKETSPSSPSPPPGISIKLGGPNASNGTQAYALLVGKLEDAPENEIISIPITRLPVTLGKDHPTKDPAFIGLHESNNSNTDSQPDGHNHSAYLSQSMCCIFYRDAHGGKLGLYKKGRKKEHHNHTTGEKNNDDKKESVMADPLDGMVYKPYDNTHTHNIMNVDSNENEKSSSHTSHSSSTHHHPPPDDILRLPDMDDKAPLPSSGFFAIECTGRKITVGGRILKKGQSALLDDGIPIKIASHCFYFLLPTLSSSTSPSRPSIKVKVTTPAPIVIIKPEKIVSSSNVEIEESKEKEDTTTNTTEQQSQQQQPPQPPPAKKPRKSEDFVSSFDDKSDQQLLALLSKKVTQSSSWDHEGQKLGSTIATRVCRAAAASAPIRKIVRSEGGVTQREILDWMNNPDSSNVYRDYESLMLTKIEKKSFMMSMGKAILRSGYQKNDFLSGRAFRWNLPVDVVAEEGEGEESAGGSVSGMEEGDSQENKKSTKMSAVKSEDEDDDDDDISRTHDDDVPEQQGDASDPEKMEQSDENTEDEGED